MSVQVRSDLPSPLWEIAADVSRKIGCWRRLTKAKRAKDVPHLAKLQAEAKGKTRITIMLDNFVIEAFRQLAEQEDIGYQTLMIGSRVSAGAFSSMISFMNQYTAAIQKDDTFWVGWIEEVPGVNAQGKSREDLLENLRSALFEALEMNREEAQQAAGDNFEEVQISA